MNNSITICFYGSSDNDLKDEHDEEINTIINHIINLNFSNIKIITGGYGGIMDSIASKFNNIKKILDKSKTIEIIGITCDAYEFEENGENYNKSNDYSQSNDLIIQAVDFSDRIQSMIELSDIFIVLPGKQGSLTELLLTSESYSNNNYILNGKTAKLLIHDYWKHLLENNKFFRNFSPEIVNYFNSDNIENLISNIEISEKKIQLPNFSEDDSPYKNYKPKDYISSKFIELKTDILKIITSRFYDGNAALFKRIGIKNDNSLLAIDFGWFLNDKEEEKKDGAYFSFSTEFYNNLLDSFFLKHNSIMLCEFDNVFKCDHINGHFEFEFNLENKNIEKTIPQIDSNKKHATYDDWKNFLNDAEYGQTLIWRGVKIAAQGNSNEIVLSVFILLNHKTPRRKIEKIRQIMDSFLLSISSKKSAQLFEDKDFALTKQATSAAISQVMARNMSHNIGSHVLSRLVTPEILEKLFNACSESKELFKLYHPLFDEKIAGSALFANLNTYQKTRMDFLADVTFGEPAMENSRLLRAEILKELDDNRLLLENISGTDNFHYEFIVRNCTNCKKECCNEHNIEACINCETCIINEESKNDIQVSMPNDILGYHALFLILENIIRNCAKHSGVAADVKDRLKIYIDVKENHKAPDFYEVQIYDSNEVGKDKLNKLVIDQNKTINKDVLEGNNLRQGGWGLIEMEAAAAYLRKQPIEHINDERYDIDLNEQDSIFSEGLKNNPDKEPNFLKAINVRDKHYGYRLFLLKPKELLVVYDEKLKVNLNGVLNSLNKVEQTKKGIKTIALTEMNNTIEEGKVFAYPLMVYIGSTKNYKNSISPNATALPNRILWYPKNEDNVNESTRFVHILDKTAFCGLHLYADDSINHCWKTWIIKQNEFLGVGINEDVFFNDGGIGIFTAKYKTELGYFSNCDFNDDYNVKFEDHGVIGILGKLSKEEEANPFYIEPYNSKDKYILSKLIIINRENGECLSLENFKSFCKLIEATTSCIHILDERIQELAEKTWFRAEAKTQDITKKLLFTDVLYASKVVVPLTSNKIESKRTNKSNTINLNQNAYKDSCKDIIGYIKSILKQTDDKSLARDKADFLLIHLGIIEKLIEAHKQTNNGEKYNREADGVQKFIEEVLLVKKENVATKIIIISGRGKPHNMPKNYLYLNFSLVSQYCIENRLKYLLNEVVFSSKKIK